MMNVQSSTEGDNSRACIQVPTATKRVTRQVKQQLASVTAQRNQDSQQLRLESQAVANVAAVPQPQAEVQKTKRRHRGRKVYLPCVVCLCVGHLEVHMQFCLASTGQNMLLLL